MSAASVSATQVDLGDIQVRSATFRDAPAEVRARLAEDLRGLPARERVLLDTCHRVELVAVGADAPEAAGTSLAGRAAVRRVFEVVAGFDSAVMAEEQLQGQVRDAYESALADGETGPVLNELFRRALRFGRRVRSHARPGTDRSLADPGVAWLVDRLAPGEPVVVAGTGTMGRLVAHGLSRAGHPVTVLSRSAERAAALVASLPAPARHRGAAGPLTRGMVARAAGVALAVRGPAPILTPAALDGARPWTLDLSVPSAVAPEAADLLGDRLRTVDALRPDDPPQPVLDRPIERRLRGELDEQVDGFVRWLAARRGGEALAVLHAEAEEVRRRHLDRLRNRAGLDGRQLAAVEAASAAMLGELLHGPSVALRHGGTDAEAVRRLFGIDR